MVTFVRHPPPAVAPGVCYGRADLRAPLPPAAELDALAAALPGATRLATSPLGRCADLAAALAPRLGLGPVLDPRLAEIDFGAWEMRAWDDIPRHEIDAWAADVAGARPHGGESVRQMTERLAAFLADCEGHDVIAVTHQGAIRCAHAALGLSGALEMRVPFCGIVTLPSGPAHQPPDARRRR